MAERILLTTLQAVVDAVNAFNVDYAVTGSVASSLQGEPFASLDVDVAVRMTESQARAIARALRPRFYANEDSLAEAARVHGMANVIESTTQFKVDLSVLAPTPFHNNVFARRELLPYGLGADAPLFYTVSPEDIILMKLVWRKDSRSRKQWDNALGVVRVKGASLNWQYLFEQARALGIQDDLIALRDEGGV